MLVQSVFLSVYHFKTISHVSLNQRKDFCPVGPQQVLYRFYFPSVKNELYIISKPSPEHNSTNLKTSVFQEASTETVQFLSPVSSPSSLPFQDVLTCITLPNQWAVSHETSMGIVQYLFKVPPPSGLPFLKIISHM